MFGFGLCCLFCVVNYVLFVVLIVLLCWLFVGLGSLLVLWCAFLVVLVFVVRCAFPL